MRFVNQVFAMTHESSDEIIFEEPLPHDPCALLQQWFDFAQHNSRKHNWNAFMLATSNPETHQPSVRAVLMKHFDTSAGQITFYTNYNSRKAREIEINPRVAAAFHWDDIERQIRVRGTVKRASHEISDAYFATRSRESQIGAWASDQSKELAGGWEELLEKVMHYAMKFPADQSVPRPPHWGGYAITATQIEFWHGRTGRIHERVGYFSDDKAGSSTSKWRAAWLAP